MKVLQMPDSKIYIINPVDTEIKYFSLEKC